MAARRGGRGGRGSGAGTGAGAGRRGQAGGDAPGGGDATGVGDGQDGRRSETAGEPVVKPTVTLGIRPVGAALPEIPRYTATELSALVDETADLVRDADREAGSVRQKAADFLFRRLYLNSVRLALDPSTPVPPGVNELLERAGKSLVLSAYDFRRYVLVGAMNHHLRSGVWDGLTFDTKLELVRLIKGAGGFDPFEAAVFVAVQANAGSRVVREYVNRQLPESAESGGRPRGLTLPGLERATSPVVRLEDEAQRERLVQRIAAMPDEAAQEALMADLEKAASLLTKTLAEVRVERTKLRRQNRNRANRDRSGES